MASCTGQAAARDENGEIIRDYVTGKALLRPCRQGALRGTDPPRCIIHCTPYERQKKMQESFMRRHGDKVSALLETLDVHDLNPMDGLIEAVRLCGNMMRVFQVLVGELTEKPHVEEVYDADTQTMINTYVPGLYGHDHNMDQAPHVFLTQLNMWTERYTRACKMALDAGIDERLVRNAESTSQVFLTAFERALKTVNLTDEARTAVMQAMAREIREAVATPLQSLEASS